MDRRLFFGRIATLIGVSIAAPVVRAVVSGKVELQRSPVAGFQYHQGKAIWSSLKVGASLSLVREPDNIHDERAVRVDWQGRKIGYVPYVDNAAISHLMDAGHVLHAEIIALRESDNPWDRVEFAVFLADGGAGSRR
ncbi:MAG: HIRAN domain-containing protein [Zoogloeaceae bacterium]|jgi:hypothetical protein|nr:HIRAN domain-containing protein [Zoogloeaceae bacterium]